MAYFFRLIIFVFISFVSLPSQALLSTQKQYLMSASGIGNFSSDSASGVCGKFVSAWGSFKENLHNPVRLMLSVSCP